MASPSSDVDLRACVGRCLHTLSSSSAQSEVISALHSLLSLLRSSPEFRRVHYSPTLRFLIRNAHADWLHRLSPDQRTASWDMLFLQGPPEQALLVLLEGIGEMKPGSELHLLLFVLERFLQGGGLSELLWAFSSGSGAPDSPQLRERLLGRTTSLPDLVANRLELQNRPGFTPHCYYPELGRAMVSALQRTWQALKDGTDCSLVFVAQILGKVSIQGHSGPVMSVLVPHLSKASRSDMLWQRICWKLFENVPQRWMESVITGLVQAVTGPEALGRIIGNLVVSNKKAQFVMTHKMLLLQYKYETRVLRVVLGYLAADRDRRPLLLQVLRSLCQTWANPSAVKHTPLEQQLHVSKALLLCVRLLNDSELQELHSELLQCLLGGMQSHLDSSVEQIRRTGMVVGECLSSRMNIHGTKLKFEYESDEHTQELLSMMELTAEEEQESDQDEKKDSPVLSPEETPSTAPQNQPSSPTPDPGSDLDSDDELTPYDMSCDQKLSQASPPRYLRDCLEILTSSEDAARVELSLNAAEGLVRKNPFATKEISVKMTKVLLHMENKYSVEKFLSLRQTTMVALAVTDCVSVTQYLTTEFYSLNYSLRQRLDILEVLALAAQELSKPSSNKVELNKSAVSTPALSADLRDRPESWREVIDKRVQSKTRRFSKGSTRAPPTASPNRFAPVAGHFFFPLLRNYDKPAVTFDLLGSDHLVLGRLIHTLGLFMHLALHAPVAAQMGSALLEFVWTVRYHAEQTVRRGVLFAVSSVFLSLPSQNLLTDLGEQIFETRAWLADVAESDADADCRTLAVQSLVLLDKSLKKQLQDPHALSLES